MKYDYPSIQELRMKGKNWREIGNLYNKAHTSVMRWFAKQTQHNVDNQTIKTRKKPRVNDEPSTDKDDKLEYHSNLTFQEIRKTKYGKLEPTGYISPKDDLEWSRLYLGKHRFRWGHPYVHDILSTLRYGDKENIRVFRGGGKTSLWIGSSLRRFNEQFIPRLNICSPKRTRILFRAIRNPLLRNPLIRQHYGDLIDVDEGSVQASKTDKMIWYTDDVDYDHTDPGVRVASREDDIIGSRPGELHYEDPTQQETQAGIEKLIEWQGEVVSPMLSLEQGLVCRETMTSTSKGIGDFGDYLITQGWTYLHYKAVEVVTGTLPIHKDIVWKDIVSKSGEVQRKVDYIKEPGTYKLTNPNMDLQKLLEICALRFSHFMSQYQNEPVSKSGRYFEAEWWTEVEPFDLTNFPKYVFTDPSHGTKSDKNDYTCSITIVPYGKVLYITDMYIQKNLKFGEIKQAHKDMVLKHRALQNYMHADFREEWLVQELETEIPGVEPIKTMINKIHRINVLDNPFKLGRLRIFKTCPYINLAKTMYLQYDQTESTPTKKDDFLDILATAYDKLKWTMAEGKMYVKTWT